MPDVQSHFHKRGSPEGQVSETDLSPNGTILTSLPVTGEEGERVVVLSGSSYTWYQFLNGAWHNLSTGLNVLADVTLAADATTLSSGTFAARPVLKVYVLINGLDASGTGFLRFNGDAANNYSYRIDLNAAPYNNITGVDAILLSTVSKTTDTVWCPLEIVNIAGIFKSLVGSVYQYENASAGGNPYLLGAGWDNATDPITEITVRVDGTIKLLAGSRIIVVG